MSPELKQRNGFHWGPSQTSQPAKLPTLSPHFLLPLSICADSMKATCVSLFAVSTISLFPSSFSFCPFLDSADHHKTLGILTSGGARRPYSRAYPISARGRRDHKQQFWEVIFTRTCCYLGENTWLKSSVPSPRCLRLCYGRPFESQDFPLSCW